MSGTLALAFYRLFNVILSVFLGTLFCAASSALFALLLSVVFEGRRKEGDVLFKEISDELQWYVRFQKKDKIDISPSTPEHRPDLQARLALRAFAQSSDLPLVPGKYGPLAYALVNILSIALAAVSFLPLFGKY